jgi:hypothetical protein
VPTKSWQKIAALPKFDPLLGTLDSVEFRLEFDFAIIGTAISGDVVHVEVPFHSTWDGGFETILPQGGINWFFLGAQNFNVTDDVDVSSGPLTDSSLLSAVTGPGTGVFAFFDVGSHLEVMGGMAQADLTEGRMSITYNYTAVPEAHQWLMFCGIAVMSFGTKLALLRRAVRLAN